MSAFFLEAHAVTIDTPGGKPLVRELSLRFGQERVAIVGRNGVGKSTLLEVLTGHRPPTEGRVVNRGRLRLVPQHLDDPIPGIGSAASPGERRRHRLAVALDSHCDLLFLDEPTADLDAEGIAWLVGRLTAWRGGLLVVSHERALLRTFNQFFVVAESGCRHFAGTFEQLRAELSHERADADRRYRGELNRLISKEEHNAAVRRRRQRKKNLGRLHELKRCPSRIKLNDKRSYKQESQGKRAVLQQVRIGTARELARAARCGLSVDLPLDLVPGPRPAGGAGPLLTCTALAATSGEKVLFRDVTFDLGRDRLAICGPNGVGKTTLIEITLGLRAPYAGQVRCYTSPVGYIAQNAMNWRHDESLITLLATELRTDSLETVARALRAHRFPVALAERPLATLSPGERVRAALICLTRQTPPLELLVLDEPTQHLDFVGLEALESALAVWHGGLLLVSHDTEFLRAIGVSRTLDLSAQR